MFFSVLKNVIYRANESYLENMQCAVSAVGGVTRAGRVGCGLGSDRRKEPINNLCLESVNR